MTTYTSKNGRLAITDEVSGGCSHEITYPSNAKIRNAELKLVLIDCLKMTKRIEGVEQSQPKWLSVEDELPKTEQLVLVGCKLFCNVNFVLNVAYYCTARDRFVLVDSAFGWYEINPDDEFFRDGFHDDDEDMAKVTHWMPLPPNPREV